MRQLYFLIATVLTILIPCTAEAAVKTVAKGGFGDYSTIRSAIFDSYSGSADEIRVASGTYAENVTMKPTIKLLGGYSAADWSRDTEANVTIIDGGGTGDVITAKNGTIDGFTIKGGGATGWNAGISIVACSPTVSNNRIKQNGKHGIYVEGNSSPLIKQNIITDNTYYGIYCYSFTGGGDAKIYNNVISSNSYGIYLTSFSPDIRNNILTSNTHYGVKNNMQSFPYADYNDLWDNPFGAYDGIYTGPHDKFVDPLFVSATDSHLQTAPVMSPCIDAGVDVGIPYTNLPDMGAYESASVQDAPWPPDGLTGTPLTAMVRLDWLPNSEPDIAGYKVSYGNAPGSYTSVIDIGNITAYDVRSLLNGAAYFFAVQAYDTDTNTSGYSQEITATPTAGTHELPHYDWDGSFRNNSCTACHFKDNGTGQLLPSGFDYRYSKELCVSCHNVTGTGRGRMLQGSDSHPVFVNATTGGNNIPTYGNITGRFSNMMGSRMTPDNVIVCATCHNIMEKNEDPGRTWELTSPTYEDTWKTFALANGGWSWYDYLRPKIYESETLLSAPADIRDRRQYLSSLPLSDFNPSAGKIKFEAPYFDYAYVTLDYAYLRVGNSENVNCLDCHNIGTHQLENCLTCHQGHNYKNRHGIREDVKTTNSGLKPVVFTGITGAKSFADGDSVRDGICEVCHTTTDYYRNDGTGFVNHLSGINQSGKNCVSCHTHESGFSKY